jgi:hypothetical protein
MIIDKSLEFSVLQALAAGATNSTNTLDFSNDRSMGVGSPLFIVANVATVPVATGTYSIAVQVATDVAFTTPVTLATLTIQPTAKAGDSVWIGMPQSNLRYMRLVYTLAGTSPAVTVNAYLSDAQPNTYRAYPDGI